MGACGGKLILQGKSLQTIRTSILDYNAFVKVQYVGKITKCRIFGSDRLEVNKILFLISVSI
jgi:hypothetical protein